MFSNWRWWTQQLPRSRLWKQAFKELIHLSDPSLRSTLKHHKSTPLFVQSSLMLSYFREFLKMSDQIRGCGSSIREQTPRRPSPPRGDAAHMPVSQRNPPACGWDEGEEEQTWRIKSFQAWSSSCIPPCLSVFLCWCLTPSSPPSPSPSLSHFPPHSFPFPVPQAPMGLSDSIVDVSLMSCPQMLRSVCLPGPTEAAGLRCVRYSFLCSTQVLTMIITSALFFLGLYASMLAAAWWEQLCIRVVPSLHPPVCLSVCPSHSSEHNISRNQSKPDIGQRSLWPRNVTPFLSITQ